LDHILLKGVRAKRSQADTLEEGSSFHKSNQLRGLRVKSSTLSEGRRGASY
jgi:hypothetical protein